MTRVILLVDSEEDNRLVLRDRLKKDFEIIEAADGEEGIRLAESHSPDLILMELWLPRLNGHEAIRRIKADPALRHIPIIAVTSFAWSGDERKALDTGCDDYLTKPIEPAALLAKIREHLS
jgi:two-component system, cell cycle response regulator DivK